MTPTGSVFHVACGFFALFAAFNTAQALATSLSGNLGNIALATLYAVFTVTCMFAPGIVRRLGPRLSMVLGAIPYVGMVFSNLRPSYALSIPANAAVGLGAPLLWTGSAVFVARCAFAATSAGGTMSDLSAEGATSRLNGVFFSLYQFNGVVGMLTSSIILQTVGSDAKEVLFWVMGGIGTIGVLVLLTVRDVPASGAGDRIPRVSVGDTLRLNGRPKLALAIPITFYTGASIGFLFADFTRFCISPALGTSYNGFVMATFFGANTVATYVYGIVAGTTFGRRGLVIVATLFHVLFFGFLVFWRVPAVFAQTGTAWHRVGDERAHPSAFAALFLGAIVFALGDAVWESQIPAVLQSFFADSDDELQGAMSNMKMWQSLGFAVQVVLGVLLEHHFRAKAIILVAMQIASFVALMVLDTKVQPLDSERTAKDSQSINASVSTPLLGKA